MNLGLARDLSLISIPGLGLRLQQQQLSQDTALSSLQRLCLLVLIWVPLLAPDQLKKALREAQLP